MSAEKKHKTAIASRLVQDQASVSSLVSAMEYWENSLSDNPELISLSSAVVAPLQVAADLLSKQTVVGLAFVKFAAEMLLSNAVGFFEKLPHFNLKTFTTLKKVNQANRKGRSNLLKADRSIFSRLLITAQSREMDMKNVMKFNLDPLPCKL